MIGKTANRQVDDFVSFRKGSIMQDSQLVSSLAKLAVAFLAGASMLGPARTQEAMSGDASVLYIKKNLVSNLAGVATTKDPNLVNAWGISFFPGGPFWISDNGTGVATLYNGQGGVLSLTVTIPAPKNAPHGTVSAPTGQVANVTQDFVISNAPGVSAKAAYYASGPAQFIFATEDGTVSAWNGSVDLKNALLVVDNSSAKAVYKGLAAGSNAGGNFLFATNFRAGKIEVFDKSFQAVPLPAGSFSDPAIPAGYAPFGIANISGDLFVTYAKQDAAKHDDVAGPGHGFIDAFDTSGHLLRRFAARGPLNSPWGVALAPLGFGKFGGEILIGNFGDGRINVFGANGAFQGQLRAKDSAPPFKIDGLWALIFGGASKSSPDSLFFTAGPGGEKNGLFGSIRANGF